jgi:hypothetical protein
MRRWEVLYRGGQLAINRRLSEPEQGGLEAEKLRWILTFYQGTILALSQRTQALSATPHASISHASSNSRLLAGWPRRQSKTHQ